jgi:hypothetical protein
MIIAANKSGNVGDFNRFLMAKSGSVLDQADLLLPSHLINHSILMQTLNRTTKQILALILTTCALLLGAVPGFAQAPSTSAATPTVPQGQVISAWNSSGTYTNIAVENYFEVWYAADPYFHTMADTGSNVLLYADMSCCAAITTGTNAPINASGCTNLHIDVYTPQGNNLTVRLVDTSNRAADANYLVAGGVITNNGWISLDMSLAAFKTANPALDLNYIKQIGFVDNNAGAVTPASYYIDNVYFNAGTNLVFTPPPAIPTPTNNAPTPTASPTLSLYNSSATYTDVTASEWPTFWSGSACTPFVITNPPGSTVKYMPGLTYVGVQYPPNTVDTTGYNTLHFDVWTLDGNQIGIQLVSLAPTAAAQVYTNIGSTQQWVSVNIPLSQFAAANPGTILTNIEQVLFVDNGGPGIQNATFYIDNMYFYSNAVVTPPPVVVTNNLVANWNFETNGATSTGLASWETAGSGGAIATPVTNNITDPYAGLQAISIEGQGTGVGAGPVFYQNNIPVVPGTLTLSFYAKAAIKDGGASPQYQISWRNAANAEIGVSGFTPWPTALNTSTYTLETISGLTAPAGSDHCTINLLLAVGAGTGDHWKVLVDDLALVQNTIVPPSTVIDYPTNAAPNPTAAQANVVSLYNSSGNYTNVNIDTWLTGWSQATYSPYTITNASRVVKRYSNLNYAGVEFFNPRINASSMSTFHVDLWTPNASKFSVKLVSGTWPTTQEYEVVFTNNVIVTNQWVSLDIPVATFTAGNPSLNLTDLGQLLFANNNPAPPQLGTFYIDNVYFYSSAVAPNSPTITAPAVGGGNFTMQVNSQTGYDYVLQATPSLAPANWTSIQTNAGTGGVLNFSVPVSSGNPQQFYRVNVQ